MRILVAYRAIDNIAGGVERMSIALMNEMVMRGHDVHFFTLDRKEAVSFYPMDEHIIWHRLGIGDYKQKASWKLRFQRAIASRKILKAIKPDIIVGFQDGAFLQMRTYSLGLGIPVVLAERVAPAYLDFMKPKFKKMLFQLYRFADAITVQCESYVQEYPVFLRKKITVIPNSVEPPARLAVPAGNTVNIKKLLCVGRIGYQKNQAVLVDVFSRLFKDFPDWKLVLAGPEDNDAIRRQAAPLGDAVEFLGVVKDVSALYETSHLFCLPSRWEGFPNALAEAMAHGLPAVGFAECGGVRDLIIQNETGLLAEGNDYAYTLEAALRRLMRDDALRGWMGIAASQSVTQYAPRAIFDRWDAFFKSVAA